MKHTIAIVGAGISGLLLAERLQEAGAKVVVLEKSRGYGGRMATKRVGQAVFDQGAQFITARHPVFAEKISEWRKQGLLVDWPETQHRSIGAKGMTTLPKYLGEKLKILRENRVTAVRRHACGCWELDIAEQGVMRAERLILTCPLPQSLALLDAGKVDLPEEVLRLRDLTYNPCLALLLTLDGQSAIPTTGVALTEGPVRWIADNVHKNLGMSPGAVTVHASPEYSEKHYGDGADQVAEDLLPHVEPFLNGARVTSTTLHRWRFSEPRSQHEKLSLWFPELTLGFAGDAFGGPKVEGAALSGLALAEQVIATLNQPICPESNNT